MTEGRKTRTEKGMLNGVALIGIFAILAIALFVIKPSYVGQFSSDYAVFASLEVRKDVLNAYYLANAAITQGYLNVLAEDFNRAASGRPLDENELIICCNDTNYALGQVRVGNPFPLAGVDVNCKIQTPPDDPGTAENEFETPDRNADKNIWTQFDLLHRINATNCDVNTRFIQEFTPIDGVDPGLFGHDTRLSYVDVNVDVNCASESNILESSLVITYNKPLRYQKVLDLNLVFSGFSDDPENPTIREVEKIDDICELYRDTCTCPREPGPPVCENVCDDPLENNPSCNYVGGCGQGDFCDVRCVYTEKVSCNFVFYDTNSTSTAKSGLDQVGGHQGKRITLGPLMRCNASCDDLVSCDNDTDPDTGETECCNCPDGVDPNFCVPI